MIIRPDQMVALGDVRLRVFVRHLAEHLKSDFAAELAAHGTAATDLEDLLRRGIAEASRYGVETESDLWLFGECIAIFGPRFPENEPWAQQVLGRKAANGTEKMDEINKYMLFSLRPPR